VAENAPKIAISTPPALTGREDWRLKQELTVNKQVKEYVSKVQEETNKLSDHISTIHTLANEKEYLKKRTHKAEQENKKLKEELKVLVKEREGIIKFTSKLEVNGKPFMEAFNEHNKEQEKQQQKNSIKMRW
jgi:DNA repair exonuclease SbcCD ATPase subunit